MLISGIPEISGRGGASSLRRLLAEPGLRFRERIRDPRQQRLQVARLHGRAAPDAQAGRSVAVMAEIVAGAGLLDDRDHLLGEGRLRIGRQRRHRRVGELQAHRGVRARLRLQREEVDPVVLAHELGDDAGVAIGTLHEAVEPADLLGPGQRIEIILDREHGRRVDRLAGEDALGELAARGHAEDFRQRPGRLVGQEPLDRTGREHDHAMRGLAAEHLLPGEGDDIELGPIELLGEGGRGRVADRQPLAVIGDPAGVDDAHARGRAVPGEDDVAVLAVDLLQVRQFAIGGGEGAHIRQLELLGDVGDPALAKALPGDHVDAAGAQHRPHRHLDGAGVGGRHDADAVIGRDLQHLARQVDREFELVLADLGAVRAAERCITKGLEGPAGALGAGAGREMRHARARSRNRIRHRCLHPYRWARRVGAACPVDGRRMAGRGESSGGQLTRPSRFALMPRTRAGGLHVTIRSRESATSSRR